MAIKSMKIFQTFFVLVHYYRMYENYHFTELHINHIENNSIGDIMFPDLKSLKSDCKIFNYYFPETKL